MKSFGHIEKFLSQKKPFSSLVVHKSFVCPAPSGGDTGGIWGRGGGA